MALQALLLPGPPSEPQKRIILDGLALKKSISSVLKKQLNEPFF
jgi:hypothetical protein